MPGFENISTVEIKDGNLLKDFYQGNYGGITVSYHNGKQLFRGIASEDVWLGITPQNFYLDKGQYFITIGDRVTNINANIFLEIVDDSMKKTIAQVPEDHFFSLNSRCRVKFTVGIKQNNKVNFELNPVIYKINNNELGLEKNAIWENVPCNLDYDDKLLFNRYINNLSSYYEIILKYVDGTTSVYSSGKWRQGSIDDLGRIL